MRAIAVVDLIFVKLNPIPLSIVAVNLLALNQCAALKKQAYPRRYKKSDLVAVLLKALLFIILKN